MFGIDLKFKNLFGSKEMKSHFFAIGLVAACLMAPQMAHAQTGGWSDVKYADDQCFIERSISNVGTIFIYKNETSFGVALSGAEGFDTNSVKKFVSIIPEDGFPDYYNLKEELEGVLTFDVPTGYFELNPAERIKNIIFFQAGASVEIPFNMSQSLFSNLRRCQEPVLAEDQRGQGRSKQPGLFDVFFDEYIVQEQSESSDEIAIERVERDDDRGPALREAPARVVGDGLNVEETAPFFEEMQSALQQGIFVPVDSMIEENQINLDEQLEIIDSLTEKIRILEIEKEYLRSELGQDRQDPINLVAGSAKKE